MVSNQSLHLHFLRKYIANGDTIIIKTRLTLAKTSYINNAWISACWRIKHAGRKAQSVCHICRSGVLNVFFADYGCGGVSVWFLRGGDFYRAKLVGFDSACIKG